MGDVNRRTFLSATAATLIASAARTRAQAPSPLPIKTIRTRTLEIGYHESGDPSGAAVIMLHGFPDDAHAYDGVLPLVAKAGHRAIAPYIRGFGPTRFLDPQAPRMAEQAAIGQDVIDLADALGLKTFAVAGYDWGGRASAVAAALHPDRVRAAVLIGGYSVQNTTAMPAPGSAIGARNAWYQWYFNTEIGRAGLARNRRELCELMWREWSPTWKFTPELYAQTAASFDNPDFVDCVIHSYRHRNFNAPGDPRFADDEQRLAKRPPVVAPTIALYGADDLFGRGSTAISPGERAVMPKLIEKRAIEGAGHFLPHEKPEPVAQAIIEVLRAS
jgi:pimeloyl-ACP methyl ester carboxylesterase